MTGHIKMKNTKMLEQLQNQIEKWYRGKMDIPNTNT